jgi:putative inorganic carbon (HCO3(-)) transporter
MHRLNGLEQIFIHPSVAHAIESSAIVAALFALWWLLRLGSPSTVIALGIGAEIFSGNWKYIPLPIPLDRLLLGLGICVLVLRGARATSAYKVVIRPIHLLLFAVAGYAAASALWAGTLTQSHGFYALLDRLGIFPFLFFALAPTLFGTSQQRRILLAVMVAVGLYLGITALAEGIGPSALVFPHFIKNLNIGITAGRARGPFLASDAMGLALFDCGVFAAIAFTVWKSRAARILAGTVIVLSATGVFLTLTRSSWLGAALGALVGLSLDKRLRRVLPKVIVVVALMLGITLVAVPSIANHVHSRVKTEQSIWDRYNTNWAAVRMAESHPLFGVGWQEFETLSWQYLRVPGTYPQTGDSIEPHNVFVSHFAELGFLGGGLWALAFLTGVVGSLFRRGPPELWAWRIGLAAMAVMFFVEANLVPLSYAFPNLILWLMAGIVSRDWIGAPRRLDSLVEYDALDARSSRGDELVPSDVS